MLTSILAFAYVGMALLEIAAEPVELGQGRTIEPWFVAATFATGAVGLTLAARSSWQLLGATGQEIVDGPLRLAMMAMWWTFGMLAAGPAVALIGAVRTGAWYALSLAFFSGTCFFMPCALIQIWGLRRIKARRSV
ncbi:MAG TPA: hypothetical protein VFC19_32040 [Candidatus Limnocylindrales bacterium]|nr:hypothetical protein [Candidatus Limnocylindrales bacterium]